ncbi:MAG: hypothetical protein ACI4AA_05450 [Lachnospiraceae bacterium]
MRFQTINALHLFNFEEVTVKQLEAREDSVTVVMEALIVKGNNPNNEECVDRFADTANVRFLDGRIMKIIKEGYKYYDADNKLLEEKPDSTIPETEYESLLKQCKDVWLFDIVASGQEDDRYEYQLGIDLNEEDTYWITIQCAETIVEWEKFKNKVMK